MSFLLNYTRNISSLFGIFFVILMHRETVVAVGSMRRYDGNHTLEQGPSKRLEATITSSESISSRMKRMKKPCILFYVEYERFWNDTTHKLEKFSGNPWVCELDAEDRVRHSQIQTYYAVCYHQLSLLIAIIFLHLSAIIDIWV